LAIDDGTYEFDVQVAEQTAHVKLPLLGEHNVLNALAATAVGVVSGMSLPEIVHALSSVVLLSPWRMEKSVLANGVTVINDAYNANPSSMEVSINNFDEQTKGKIRIAIIGGMNELGDTSVEEHQKLIQQLEEKKFNKVFLIGSHFAKLNVAESFQKIDKIEDISYHELTDSFSGSFIY
jgi:UDP-N-acetylmuramoyl-tripeptide--D-alanyl-D-alanine ligase